MRLSKRHIVLAALLAASALFLLYSMKSMPQKITQKPTEDAPQADQAAPPKTLGPAAPADVDFSRYASLARTNIFSEQRSKPPPPPPKKTPPKLPPLPDGSETPKPPERRLDFSGWTYLGYVQVDGKKLGLLAKDATDTCEFVAVGETFMGAKVESLDRDDIRLRAGTSQTTLSRPRDFPVTPLTPAAASGPQRPVRGAG